MKEKAIKIIAILVIVVLIIGFVAFKELTKKEDISYGVIKASSGSEIEYFFSDYRTYNNTVKKLGFEEDITIDLKKYNFKDRYTEEYFETKNLAMLGIYEDNSRDYTYGISDIEYNDDKTVATVIYYNFSNNNTETLSQSWRNFLVVELDKTVTDCLYKLDNTTCEFYSEK